MTRVLYVSQPTEISGAERSLLDLLDNLPAAIDPVAASPPGRMHDALAARGIPVERIAPVDLSFRVHPVRTPVGLAWIPRTAMAVRTIARRVRRRDPAREQHPCRVSRRLVRPHRGPARIGPRPGPGSGRLGRLADPESGRALRGPRRRQLRVRRPEFPSGAPASTSSTTGSTRSQFDPAAVDRAAARAELGLEPGEPALGVVAHFTPWKAQDDAVRILAELRAGHQARVCCSRARQVHGPRRPLRHRRLPRRGRGARRLARPRRAGLLPRRGRRRAPGAQGRDVLLVPSWREAFGRSVIEGMAMGLPVVATAEGGPAEVIEDGVDGFLVEPRQPARWAETVGAPARGAGAGARRSERGAREGAAELLVGGPRSAICRDLRRAPQRGGGD